MAAGGAESSLPTEPLPGGGVLRTLGSRDGLSALEQRLDDGQTFRWLCSLDHTGRLLAETVVRCSCTTRSGGARFDRELLMPRYHAAMVAGLGLHRNRLRRVLLIGVGGGALAMFLRHAYGAELTLTCVDSSRAAIELGRKHFGLLADRRLLLVECAAECFLQQIAPTERFDAILVDTTEVAAGGHEGGLSAPHRGLRRRRAIRSLFGRLAEGGVLVVNVLGDDPSVARLQHVVAGACNRHTALYRLSTDEGNVVLAARIDDGAMDLPNVHWHVADAAWWDGCAALGLDVQSVDCL